MRNAIWIATCLACLLGTTGCLREYVPITADPARLRVPNQQLLLADSADQAFENIDLSSLAGKSVYVEAVGVLPHTPEDLMDYLIYRTELQLSQDGALVHRVGYRSVSLEDGVDIPMGGKSYRAAAEVPEDAEYRVILAVRAAGADISSFDNFIVQKKHIIGRVSLEIAALPTRSGLQPHVEPVGEAVQLGRGFGENTLMWDGSFLYIIPNPQVPYTGGLPISFGERVLGALGAGSM